MRNLLKVKLITTSLLILCGLGIGWLAYENLMWAVWGKQNRWFEYVGFYGCPVMLVAAFIALKNLQLGSIFGGIGFGLMLFYLVPALFNTILRMRYGNLVLETPQILQFVLLIVVPLLTLVTLIWNLKRVPKSPQ